MIEVVLVDDERPALRGLEHLLKEYSEISIVGMFTNPLKAIDEMGKRKPQAVFLDINMPQLQGMDAASRILDLSPDTDIIFVTAFDQYAIEAFELHVIDYILKPVTPDRLRKTVNRLLQKKNLALVSGSVAKIQINCLGKFQLCWQDHEPIKWRTEKTRQLFAFLLHHQGREVSKDEIIDALWPEGNIEKAVHQLHNGIYYIRKTLEKHGIDRSLINISGSYCMKLGNVDMDISKFNECCARIKKYNNIHDLKEAESLYKGDYFEGTDWVWSEIYRQTISRQYDEIIIKLADSCMDAKEYDQSEELLLKGFNKNPYEERITELILMLYKITNNKAKGIKHFSKYKKILQKDIGIKPGEKIQKILDSME